MHLTPWLVFFLAYFGIYLFIAWKQETINVFAFFIGYLLIRVPIAATFAILYWLAQEEPVTMNEVLPEQKPVPTLQLSDIMTDDLKDHEVQMEPAIILPTIEE